MHDEMRNIEGQNLLKVRIIHSKGNEKIINGLDRELKTIGKGSERQNSLSAELDKIA